MASIPTAPLPANKSSQTESATIGATTLKSVSRSRSEVGRVCMPGGASSLRLLYFPAITRMTSNLPYRITDRLGCSDLCWMADQPRAQLGRRAAGHKRRRIIGPKLQFSGVERSDKENEKLVSVHGEVWRARSPHPPYLCRSAAVSIAGGSQPQRSEGDHAGCDYYWPDLTLSPVA